MKTQSRPTSAVSDCLCCKREFFASKCPDHCTPRCCKATDCQVGGTTSSTGVRPKHCKVCGKSGKWYVRFAPCDSGCTRLYHASTRGDYARSWQCLRHTPVAKSRLHIHYCSITCYNHTLRGHEQRVRWGNRAKWIKGNLRRRWKGGG
jgi:hypothetical protein